MKQWQRYVIIVCLVSVSSGCSFWHALFLGYSFTPTLPNDIATISVPTFYNEVDPERAQTYQAGLEVNITNAVIKQLLFDGNLRVVGEAEGSEVVVETDAPVAPAAPPAYKGPDAMLLGTLLTVDQEPVRFNSLEGVEEYRLFLVVSLVLKDMRTNEILWTEPHFSGDTEFFLQGPSAISRQVAADRAVLNLAENIVDRIVEDW